MVRIGFSTTAVNFFSFAVSALTSHFRSFPRRLQMPIADLARLAGLARLEDLARLADLARFSVRDEGHC